MQEDKKPIKYQSIILQFTRTLEKSLETFIISDIIQAKTTKSNILISPFYDTNGNGFTPFASKLLSA